MRVISAVSSVALTFALGCTRADPGFGPAPACNDPSGCSVLPIGGASGAGGGGGGNSTGAGGAAPGTLQGIVGVVRDSTFQTLIAFDGAATIGAPSAAGGQAEAPYMDAATGFSLSGLASGPQWVFAKDDTNGASMIWSTHSVQGVPRAGAVVPVIDVSMMNTIASGLPAPVVLLQGDAQIVLSFLRGGAPLHGVSVADGMGGVVAYDQGPGVYSNQATSTGTVGTILLLNVPAAATTLSLVVSDGTANFMLSGIVIGPGEATIERFQL